MIDKIIRHPYRPGLVLAFEVTDDNGHPLFRAWEEVERRKRADAGERTDYGPNWPAVRDRIVLRDGFACVDCGVGEDLQVHHIRRLCEFEGDTEAANQPQNLVTLCRSCHLGRHGKRRRG